MRAGMNVRCVILGGGGHARVVIDILRIMKKIIPYAVLDHDRSLWNSDLLGVPVRGGDELLPDLMKDGITHFIVGLGSVGDHRPRRRLFELGLKHGLKPLVARHPSVVCSSFAQIGPGSVLFPISVVNAGSVIGANVIINTGALVEHDCNIGDHAHIATGAKLAGSVKIGEGAHIGGGATVLQCICVGREAIVGAGAVVVRDVPPHAVVAGVPARILKKT